MFTTSGDPHNPSGPLSVRRHGRGMDAGVMSPGRSHTNTRASLRHCESSSSRSPPFTAPTSPPTMAAVVLVWSGLEDRAARGVLGRRCLHDDGADSR
jgi:hypothetical protein